MSIPLEAVFLELLLGCLLEDDLWQCQLLRLLKQKSFGKLLVLGPALHLRVLMVSVSILLEVVSRELFQGCWLED